MANICYISSSLKQSSILLLDAVSCDNKDPASRGKEFSTFVSQSYFKPFMDFCLE